MQKSITIKFLYTPIFLLSLIGSHNLLAQEAGGYKTEQQSIWEVLLQDKEKQEERQNHIQEERFLKQLKNGRFVEALDLLRSGISVREDIKDYAAREAKSSRPETIQILNLLGVPPFGMASIMPYSAALDLVRENDVAVDQQFLEEYFEIQQRVILAATLGLKGNSTIRGRQFELEGSKQRIMREAFLESLARIDLKTFPESIRHAVSRMLENTFALKRDVTELLKKEKGEFAFNAGADRHSFSVYFNPTKNQLIIGNRGDRPEHIPSGLLVFSTGNAQEQEITELFEFMDSFEKDYYKKLYDKLYAKFGAPVSVLKLTEQEVGNCTWIALELILLSFLYTDSLVDRRDIKLHYENLLAAIHIDRARTYVSSPSKIKSKELLESCFHFGSGAMLKTLSLSGVSQIPGDAMYFWGTSLRSAELRDLAAAELKKNNHDAPSQSWNRIAVAIQTSVLATLGLTLYGISKLGRCLYGCARG